MKTVTLKVKPGSELSVWCNLNYRQLRFMDREASLLQQYQELRTKDKKLLKAGNIFDFFFVAGSAIAIAFSLFALQIVCSALLIISLIVSAVLKDRNLKKRNRVLEQIKSVTDMIEQERQGQSPLTKWNYRF